MSPTECMPPWTSAMSWLARASALAAAASTASARQGSSDLLHPAAADAPAVGLADAATVPAAVRTCCSHAAACSTWGVGWHVGGSRGASAYHSCNTAAPVLAAGAVPLPHQPRSVPPPPAAAPAALAASMRWRLHAGKRSSAARLLALGASAAGKAEAGASARQLLVARASAKKLVSRSASSPQHKVAAGTRPSSPASSTHRM